MRRVAENTSVWRSGDAGLFVTLRELVKGLRLKRAWEKTIPGLRMAGVVCCLPGDRGWPKLRPGILVICPGSAWVWPFTRTIVTCHEGRIRVESTLGKGATLYFTLPARKIAPVFVRSGVYLFLEGGCLRQSLRRAGNTTGTWSDPGFSQ